MKNNHLTNKELLEIKDAVHAIRRLAAMDNCSFKDQKTVDMEQLKLWLQWFKSNARTIEKIVGSVDDDE